jgi:fructokinase
MSGKIICIGELLWDSLPMGLFIGGAPFNVACHLKMLGEEVEICSRVGNDVLGNQAIERVLQKQLKTEFLQVDSLYPTGFVDVNLDGSGNATYDIVKPVAWDYIDLNHSLLQECNNSDILVYGTLAQRNDVSRKTIKQLQSMDKINIYDVNFRSPFIEQDIIRESLHAASIVKINEYELVNIAEWFDLSSNLQQGMKDLAIKFNCDTVCLTRGAKGSVILRDNKFTVHGGYNVRTKDTVGAGDAFLAALIHGINNEKRMFATSYEFFR